MAATATMGAPANRVVSSSFDSPVFICGSREGGGEGRGVVNGSFTIPQAAITEELLPSFREHHTKPNPPTVPHPLYPTHFGDVLLFLLVLEEVHFVQDHHHLTAGDFANHQTLQEGRGEGREGGGREERRGGGREERGGEGREGREGGEGRGGEGGGGRRGEGRGREGEGGEIYT